MNNHQMQAAIAFLESKVDMLETELVHLDQMLRKCGFPEGIQTLKCSMDELLKEESFLEEKSNLSDFS